MFLFAIILSCVFGAVVSLTDKFILEKSVPKPIVFVFYSCIFVLPVLLLVPFGVRFPAGLFDWSIAILAGLFFVVGLWVYYTALLQSEVSHMAPFVGAAVAFFTVILSRTFLAEQLSGEQWAAIGVLIGGTLLISFEKSKQHSGLHIGLLWGLLSALLFASSHIAGKYIYGQYDFYSGFIWTRGIIGLAAVPLLFSPSVRRALVRPRDGSPVKSTAGQVTLVATNKLLAVAAIILAQYAMSIGSVSIVNALSGLAFVILLFLVAFFSKFFPEFFKEDYTKAEIVQEILSVVLIGIGLALLI